MKKVPKLAGALRTERIVGRTKELAAIKDAIQAEGELRILYIISEGGIGKTRLLEEVPRIIDESQNKRGSYQHAGPFDFYLSSIQSIGDLEIALAKALNPQGHVFQSYLDARDQFMKFRAAGGDPQQVERRRQRVDECFVEGFNEFSSQSRVVLALDTLEVIQYESDVVQKVCGIALTGLEVKDWLLNNVPRLKNTVVILAGREKQELIADFRRHFGDQLRILYLGPFSESETLDYFAAIAEAEPAFREIGISTDQQCVIHHYTAGHPLKLAFAIELLTRNLPLPQELFDSRESAQERSDDELQAVREQVEESLVTGIMTADRQIDGALPYIALARKGVNPELLERLTGWPRKICAQVLRNLRHFSFVKVRPGTNWLFLHDEMYDLMEKHAWSRMELEREYVCTIILGYYDERIERTKTLSRQEDLVVEQLYYQFLADPRDGYAQYARLSDAALFRHNVGFDMRLRDEMLRFCNRYPDRVKRYNLTKEFIDYDAAVRWVKRYLYTGKYDEATEVAEAAKADPDLYHRDTSSFRFARAELDVYHALALIYTGKIEPAVTMLNTVLANLEGMSEPEVLAYQGAPASFDIWRRNLVLGWAHNNLGYVYRTRLGHYRAALEEFRSALPYFLASDLGEEIANTYDNMGRVHALLGEKTRAESLARDGLELRRHLGREFRIGLSLNSLAIVHLGFGEPHRARHLSEQALHIFERLGIQRGIGLARITLGRSLRHLGALWRIGIYNPEECHKLLDDAVASLERAADIFPKIVDEPIRGIEACNELGCTHRERAALVHSEDPGSPLVGEEEEKAVQYLTEAIGQAEGKNPVLYVDSCEDLAQVYFQGKDFDNTEFWLNRAADVIPSIYKIEQDSELRDIPVEECIEEFWRQMGKIEMLRGHLIFDRRSDSGGKVPRQVLEQAMRHYVLAVAYFEQYSEHTVQSHTALERLYGNFRRCERGDLRYVQDEVLPSIAVIYALDVAHLRETFEDTLGLALLIAK